MKEPDDRAAECPRRRRKRAYQVVEDNLFSYVDRRGPKRFHVRLMAEGRLWRRFGFLTITAARNWRDSRKGAIADGRRFPEQERAERAATLFSEYAEKWTASREAKGLKRGTLRSYEGILKTHLLPAFGRLPLCDITLAKVRELAISCHREGLKPKTIHNIVRALSCLFSQAIEDEVVGHNPAGRPSGMVQLAKRGEHVAVFADDEERHLLSIARKYAPRDYPFILALFRTGARFGEAVALMPEDLNFRDHYVVIERNYTHGHLEDRPKSGRRRDVDLADDLIATLKEQLAMQEAEAALAGTPRPKWLFSSPEGGIIRSNNFRDRVWRPLLKKAGLNYRRIHATRHTFATRLIMAGEKLVYVQKQLGHSSIQITVDLYTHWLSRLDGASRSRRVNRLVFQDETERGGQHLVSQSEMEGASD